MKKNETTIIYPGTFDPITNGHVDLIERATKLFTKVIIAIADNAQKKPFFTLSERIELVKEALQQSENVEICSFSGLLVDFVRAKNSFVVLRGLRAISDFEYEFQLAGMNRKMEPRLETVFLTPSEQYAYLSSSLVREIALLNGDISSFVPPVVSEMFSKKINILE